MTIPTTMNSTSNTTTAMRVGNTAISAAPTSAVDKVTSHRQGNSAQNWSPPYAPNTGPAITSVSSAASSVIPIRCHPRQRCTASPLSVKIRIAATMPPTIDAVSSVPATAPTGSLPAGSRLTTETCSGRPSFFAVALNSGRVSVYAKKLLAWTMSSVSLLVPVM